jgi:hypothetical protein
MKITIFLVVMPCTLVEVQGYLKRNVVYLSLGLKSKPACHLLLDDSLLGLFYDPKHRRNTFISNAGGLLPRYMALLPKRLHTVGKVTPCRKYHIMKRYMNDTYHTSLYM